MPTAAVLNQVVGYLAKEEVDPNTAETLSNTTDACDVYIGDGDPEPPTPLDHIYDGNLGGSASSLGPQRRTTPNGRSRQYVYRVLPKGPGTAYSASAFPPRGIHRHLKAAGFDVAYSATPSPQHTYTPTPAGTVPTHLTTRQYLQQMQYDMRGVQCDFSYETQGLGVPVFTFTSRGIADLPTQAALPALTIEATTVIPPVAAGVVSSINGVTSLTIRSIRYVRNRAMDTARVALNLAGGHAGFIGGRYFPEWTVEIERPLLATFNPESLMANATAIAFSATFGTVQYNRWQHGTAQGQIINVQPGAEGQLATVVLTIRGFASTPTANDAESMLWN